MREVFIGEIIREKRKQLHLTQERLCEGICEPSTLSRIENKRQTPTRNVLNALLQRLGISDERFYAIVTAEELRISKICTDITNYNVQYIKATADEKNSIRQILLKKHNELKNLIDEDDIISRQFLMRSEVTISDSKTDEKIEKLLKAIRLTRPSFELSDIKNGLFSFDEIKIINHIAVVYSEAKDSERAIEIWSDLLRNNDNRFDNIMPAKTHRDLILYGLTRELLIVKDYKNALRYAQEGRELAVHCGIFLHLPGYIIIQAECEYQLGNKEESEKLLKQAYYLCEAIGDKANQEIIYNGYLEYFGKTVS